MPEGTAATRPWLVAVRPVELRHAQSTLPVEEFVSAEPPIEGVSVICVLLSCGTKPEKVTVIAPGVVDAKLPSICTDVTYLLLAPIPPCCEFQLVAEEDRPVMPWDANDSETTWIAGPAKERPSVTLDRIV